MFGVSVYIGGFQRLCYGDVSWMEWYVQLGVVLLIQSWNGLVWGDTVLPVHVKNKSCSHLTCVLVHAWNITIYKVA